MRVHDSEDVNPRNEMLADLKIFIKQRQEEGDAIVLGLDANTDVGSTRFQNFTSSMDSKNVVFSLHGENGPATCLKNKNGKPIDGLFCSLALNPMKGGYSGREEGCPSDHVQLWADFDLVELVGGE